MNGIALVGFRARRDEQQVGQLELIHSVAEQTVAFAFARDADAGPEHQARRRRALFRDVAEKLRVVRRAGIAPVDPHRGRRLGDRGQDRREKREPRRGVAPHLQCHDQVGLVRAAASTSRRARRCCNRTASSASPFGMGVGMNATITSPPSVSRATTSLVAVLRLGLLLRPVAQRLSLDGVGGERALDCLPFGQLRLGKQNNARFILPYLRVGERPQTIRAQREHRDGDQRATRFSWPRSSVHRV